MCVGWWRREWRRPLDSSFFSVCELESDLELVLAPLTVCFSICDAFQTISIVLGWSGHKWALDGLYNRQKKALSKPKTRLR